jgi:tRNA 2-thiouridine synthesizing protein B
VTTHSLHILRHSPATHASFNCWLRTVSPGQGLLLIEEAVYGLLPETRPADALNLLPSSIRLYALDDDVLARGLALDELPLRVTVIDYLQMVELCTTFDKVVSW